MIPQEAVLTLAAVLLRVRERHLRREVIGLSGAVETQVLCRGCLWTGATSLAHERHVTEVQARELLEFQLTGE